MKRQKMPRSALGRSAIATSTAARAGGKTLRFLAQKPFLGEEQREQRQSQLNTDLGETIFAGLSKLRGTALKIAQMLSLETEVLPPELQAKLRQSHYRVPPLNKALVRRVVEKEFGKPLEEVFQDFELEHFAAASLGQVHRATLFDGRRVAVKVQYPGIKDTIASDLQVVRKLIFPVIQGKISRPYLDRVLAELKDKLDEETDYILEAKRGHWFAEVNENPDLVIPRPDFEHTTARVLTTEYLEGQHLDEYARQSPSQDAVNRVCQAVLDFHVVSLMEHQTLHCDPNPGNYLFLADGRVAVIDFGCVKVYSDEEMKRIKRSIHAMIRGDKEEIYEGMCDLGLDPSDETTREAFDRYLYPFTEVLRRPHDYEVFDFKQHPIFVKDYTEALAGAIHAGQNLTHFSTETIHIDRTYHGIFRMFERLGAELRFRHPLYQEEETA